MKQHGCVAAEQAVQHISARNWARLKQHGLLIEAHPNVFRLVGTQETWMQRAWAAHLAMPSSILSHRSAAKLHGIAHWADENAPIELTVPHNGSRLSHLRIRQHCTRTPDPEKLFHRSGLPVTCPERTLLDLAAVHPARELPAIVDRFLLPKLTGSEEMFRYFQLVTLKGRKNGSRLLRLLISRAGNLSTLESRAEERTLSALNKAGLRPESQFPVVSSQGRFRLDFAFPQKMIALEVDGPHHLDPDQARADRQRDAILSALGWRVIRVSVFDDLSIVLDQLRNAV